MPAHILMVEDDDNTRMMIACQLQYAGYTVTEAPDGETAIDLLEQDLFDVVLTDIVMGKVSGIELLHTARLQEYRPAVILLTGHGTLETAIAALDGGAYKYLLKPCSNEELLTSVEGAVQRHQAESALRQLATMRPGVYNMTRSQKTMISEENSEMFTSRIVQVGDLSIGPSRNEVTFSGQFIKITPIEYSMLRCLATTPGEVRSFQDIVRYTHHLDLDDTEAQSLLKYHIRNLRRKIDPSYLVNHHGIGYMLVDPDTL